MARYLWQWYTESFRARCVAAEEEHGKIVLEVAASKIPESAQIPELAAAAVAPTPLIRLREDDIAIPLTETDSKIHSLLEKADISYLTQSIFSLDTPTITDTLAEITSYQIENEHIYSLIQLLEKTKLNMSKKMLSIVRKIQFQYYIHVLFIIYAIKYKLNTHLGPNIAEQIKIINYIHTNVNINNLLRNVQLKDISKHVNIISTPPSMDQSIDSAELDLKINTTALEKHFKDVILFQLNTYPKD